MKEESIAYESIVKRSLNAIRILKKQLESKSVDDPDESIAVIGMACRFPGGCVTPEIFWEFLKEKGDGVVDIPPDRWNIDDYYDPDANNFRKMYVRQAGFMQEDISQFDAKFFRIPPIEASEIDPQHRLLLEVSWEALERAGQNPDKLKGSNTGVFVGIIASEYAMLPRDHSKINMYWATGTLTCIASGRIAHILGLHGPTVSIDTACSSSLVSVHSACESLIRQQCDMALAGGVNMLLVPEGFSSLCMMGALEKDGRCKPFDADGQGYGRGEGCGILVLKRLSDAQKDGDIIHAVIRGGAVNHDGAGSGLTVPNGIAQKKLIIDALKKTNTKADDIVYLEAHGTGTSLGDPIEIKAITDVFGTQTRETPLIIGSVKGNIGHLEGAAGIAGLIKTVLCIQHKKIPANINLIRPNPRIRFEKIPAMVPSELINWEKPDKPFVAGMSSFGFSGTNAHLILSEFSDSTQLKSRHLSSKIPFLIMTLSAKSKTALKTLAANYQKHLNTHSDLNIQDICYTANVCRADFSHRAAFIIKDTNALINQLTRFFEDKKDQNNFYENNEEDRTLKTAFFFSNHLESDYSEIFAFWLYENIPSFCTIIKQCSEVFSSYCNTSIEQFFMTEDISKRVKTDPIIKKAYCFTFQYALAHVWQSAGVKVAAVFGNDDALYTAACVAKVMSIETAAKLITGKVESISSTDFTSPACRFLSPVDGEPVSKKNLNSYDWWKQIPASKVDHSTVENALKSQGYGFIMKVGTQFVDWKAILKNLAILYCGGYAIQWENIIPDHQCKKVILPTYAFERKRYWITPKAPDIQLKVEDLNENPLEATRIESLFVKDKIEYSWLLNIKNLPELLETHRVIHVGFWSEMFHSAINNCFKTNSYLINKIEFTSACIVSDTESKKIQLSFTPNQESKEISFVFYSKDESSEQWDSNVKGTVSINSAIYLPESKPFNTIKKNCVDAYPKEIFYQMMSGRGIVLGKGVQLIEEVFRKDCEAFARISFPSGSNKSMLYKTGIYPGVIDACSQLFHAALPDSVPPDMRYMVISWENFTFSNISNYKELWCHITIHESNDYSDSISGTFTLFDENENIICFARKNVMKGISDEMIKAMQEAVEFKEELDNELMKKLEPASSDEKKKILSSYFQKTMSDILGMPVSELSIKEPLRNIGIDSMAGLRFKTAILSTAGIDIPMEDIIEGLSIERLSEIATQSIRGHILEKNEIIKNQKSKIDHQLWFYNRKQNSKAKFRLFCFPYGIAGASIYSGWQDLLPDDVEVCPVQLPGRENRIKETSPDNIDDITDLLVNVFQEETDLPFALYGHSAGALLAFTLAHRLIESGSPPACIFPAAFTSPTIFNPVLKDFLSWWKSEGIDGVPGLDDLKGRFFEGFKDRWLPFIQEIPSESLVPDEGVKNSDDEFFKVFLPDIHCTFKILESYFCSDRKKETPVNIPIIAFHGKNDQAVTLSGMKAWKKLTTSEFKLHTLDGDHLFLTDDQSSKQLIEIISESLSHILL
ncbi:short-chain dehydrogenase [Candidatus Magnetomorum sp. HK-1]|nr:short-chain dehydrogenase [Candidatus Magnetomorum sp. HK-1]